MKILGIQAFYYNHAAALLSDGSLRFFIEEEKINRIKAQRDGFPLQSIRAGLHHEGISLEDIDEIAYPIDPWRYAWTVAKGGLGSALNSLSRRGWSREPRIGRVPLFADRVLVTLQFTPPFIDRLIRQNIRYGRIPGRLPKITHVPHHLAHAASAFYPSGMDEATIVIIDGVGETESTTLWHGRDLSITPIEKIKFPNSLGEFYAAFTEFCGFEIYNQEAKLMGLAAYGGPNEDVSRCMEDVIEVGRESYRVNPKYTIHGPHSFGYTFSDMLVELFGEPRLPNGEITQRHKDIAYAAQDLLEKAALEIVRKAVRLTGCRRVCLSGGVGMNCKLNGAILHSGLVDDLFVLPASNDAGAALGAAMENGRSAFRPHDLS